MKVKVVVKTASPGPIFSDHQRHEQGVGAAGYGDGKGHAHEGGQFFFEFADFRAQDILAMVQDFFESCLQVAGGSFSAGQPGR